MFSTPNANRKHIGIYGKTNVGKSSLINKIMDQNVSIVSPIGGTTTDPVSKPMEFIPIGPVLFIDTAGSDDDSELGSLRFNKTYDTLKRVDLSIYVFDCMDLDKDSYEKMRINFKKFNVPHIVVINKADLLKDSDREEISKDFNDFIFVSTESGEGIENLKNRIIQIFSESEYEIPIIGDILPYNSKVVMVVPIDSEAPKGRIILPQVQCIRDCLDHGIKSYVLRDTELEDGLKDLKDIDLVITDSQVFKKVSEVVPKNIPLTSFSILFARHKGNLKSFVDGVRKIEELNKDSKILIAESCSHNVSHEDIGRFKIPKLLNKHVGYELKYDFYVGNDFPDNLDEYDLVIHCGACMINRKSVINRVNFCGEKGISITNYGVVIAYLTGILDRAIEIFKKKENI
ncbi:[FeFe] hydrogenase H-cluster maturation GTPase HydF [Candidatus Arthromitus sp. SFB-rat-Yit]|uniref:[FeFe] hydrogenase H-cluster maturation GTPase HydF n=1 Tax=Candidatus Arthromitus sp. SFB-rat-Yit TaxID=1041504 RepID=UPI000227A10C|nr:[FeFe] hydrogenase H-cluster maturation GTPase HydF [Candidatus Arthromitus sp. SFB-rat-Yit]BAK81334.1 GTP-binding protein [Candidatus Arthromitus sp. SFB-rat-Yit]